MAGGGRLQSDPLFQGLARPTMILGVSYMYFVINAALNLICFINMQSFMVTLMVAPTVHVIGYLICLKEPRAIEMFIIKAAKGTKCVNRRYHKFTNSYDVY
jgi:type IV secretion system protein VirB3